MTRQECVAKLLGPAAAPTNAAGEAFAPANIALCKYWGKRDLELNLPLTSSLSISLGHLGTRTRIHAASQDRFTLNGEQLAPDSTFAKRMAAYLDLFRAEGIGFEVDTSNNIPTAAGVASSASGFAALVLALDKLFGWELEKQHLSVLARIGSGSASRSIYDGFVHWQAGVQEDGFDSYATRLDAEWPELRVGLSFVESGQKVASSTKGMERTRETSTLFEAWPKQVKEDMGTLKEAIAARDFARLGTAAERNALSMHATMLSATPPLLYWKPATIARIQQVWDLRKSGLPVYLSIDAGPNIKLLFETQSEHKIRTQFPELEVARPFQ